MALKNEEIHVLMVAFASQGHINPMLRLGKYLLSKGLRVSLATTQYARHLMLQSATIKTTTTTDEIPLLFFSDGLSLDYDRKANLDHYMETLGETGKTNLSNLIKEHYFDNKKKLHCIINNPFVPWVVDVGNDLGLPCAMLWIQPCSLYSIYYRFYNKLNQFPNDLMTNPNAKLELPGLPPLLVEDLPSFVLPSNPFGSFPKMLSLLFQQQLGVGRYKWVLGNSFLELEKDVIESMVEICPIIPVGPLVPSSSLLDHKNEITSDDFGVDMWKSDETCISWLNNQTPNSVIYVSFGSILVLTAKQMEAIANALKNINRPFIWVVRKGVEFLSGFIEDTKNQGLVVSWAPQTKILAHKATGCFVTHCGWNSMLETITAGIPVVAYPQWTDQPTNAKLISDVFLVGVRLRPNEDGIITNDHVEKCVREVMDGPNAAELKGNAAKLKAAARAAVVPGGSSDRNIQLFVEDIVGSK